MRMPLCVVAWTILAAVLTLIPQLVAKTCGVSCGPADAERTVKILARIVSQKAASSCTAKISFKAK